MKDKPGLVDWDWKGDFYTMMPVVVCLFLFTHLGQGETQFRVNLTYSCFRRKGLIRIQLSIENIRRNKVTKNQRTPNWFANMPASSSITSKLNPKPIKPPPTTCHSTPSGDHKPVSQSNTQNHILHYIR